MWLVIVSGLSGSGKSIALSTLEDCGYYCIDNLPVRLIEAFVRDANRNQGKTAISIDCRNLAGDVNLFGEALNTLKQFAIPYRILYLIADPQTLINRYSETRRKHPLSHSTGLPLADAIERERKLLEPIAACADLIIDTTHTNIHQLRELVLKRLGEDNRQLALCFTSFGFKHGLPLDADFVFDARCLPNPHWEPELRPFTGRDMQVAAYLQNLPETTQFLTQIETFLKTWLPRFSAQNRSYLTIAIGCTGGRHRSVYLAEKLGQVFSGLYPVVVRHRELA
ncbi:MAG: RNase adapter RapZ [Methylohalobius sp.]